MLATMTAPNTTTDWFTAIATGVLAVATVVAAGAAITAIVYARRTIKAGRESSQAQIDHDRAEARSRLTHEYVAKLENLELIECQALTSSFVRGGIRSPRIPSLRWAFMTPIARQDAARAYWRSLSATSALGDRKMVMRLLAYPNLLEGLASAYNEDLLDRHVIKAQVEVEANSFWNAAKWWVDQLRDEWGADTFRDIEVMIKDLASQAAPDWYA